MKRHATERIYKFVSAALSFSADKIDPTFATEIMKCLLTTNSILEKVRLYMLLLTYLLKTNPDHLTLTPEHKTVFLQFTFFYAIAMLSSAHGLWPSTLKPLLDA